MVGAPKLCERQVAPSARERLRDFRLVGPLLPARQWAVPGPYFTDSCLDALARQHLHAGGSGAASVQPRLRVAFVGDCVERLAVAGWVVGDAEESGESAAVEDLDPGLLVGEPVEGVAGQEP